MKNALMILQIAIGLVPALIELIKAVETPKNGEIKNGVEKAATVIAIIKAAFDLLPEEFIKLIGLDKLERFLTKAIEVLVKLLNAAGVLSVK